MNCLTMKLKLDILLKEKYIHYLSVRIENVYIMFANKKQFGLLQMISCLDLLMCICSLYTKPKNIFKCSLKFY